MVFWLWCKILGYKGMVLLMDSGRNWTAEQKEAITEQGCDILVSAAAGAGKTAVLVERIINKITDPDNPVDIDRLLVMTFTNAAASEMRERIAGAITERLESTPARKISCGSLRCLIMRPLRRFILSALT